MKCRPEPEKKAIISRLKRIEGQIKGLENMVETDKECIDILRQINSVSGALKGLWVKILNDHLRGCIAGALMHRDERLLDELVEHLKKVK